MNTLSGLLSRGIDAKLLLALCFALAFIPLTSGLANTLYKEHGAFLTITSNLPMAFLCLLVLACVLYPFISWNAREIALLAITVLFTVEQLVAIYFNQIDVKEYQYPVVLGIAMMGGLVAERLARHIKLNVSAPFVRKLVLFMLCFFCVEAAVRFVFSPYVRQTVAPEFSDSFLYRFKYSFFFMEANYVSMALLCLLAIMIQYREFFHRRTFWLGYALLAFTFSRTAVVPGLAQLIILRWWPHRRWLAVIILALTILGNVVAFALYLSTPGLFNDPSFVSKLYAFGLALNFLGNSGLSQQLLGMGFANSLHIIGTPVHSIPGTFMFEFGVIGSILFVSYLLIMVRKSSACLYFLIVPFAIYGISIVGIATSSFLITLGTLSANANAETNGQLTLGQGVA